MAGGGGGAGGAVAGFGGFGAAVRDRGLDDALESIGLAQLRGRPAVEVVAAVAEHLARDIGGYEGDLLARALQDALFDAAAIAEEPSYENLSASIEQFLQAEGVDGLLERFLANYVFNRFWARLEQHVEARSDANTDADALASAVFNICQREVADTLRTHTKSEEFDGQDWFGTKGQELGDEVLADLEARLDSLDEDED